MKITYERDSPNREVINNSFKAYRWSKIKDTKIIDILWGVIMTYDDYTFENLKVILVEVSEAAKEKVKSKVNIYYTEDRIEITKYNGGVFPNIIVYKNE